MKKEVQAQLEALATEILNKKDSVTTSDLKEKAAIILEQLSVLHYLEKQIGKEDKESLSKDSKSYREENWFVEPEPVPQPEHENDLVEPLMEKIKDLVAQMPQESQKVDELLEEVLPQRKYVKNDLEEFASNYQQTPTFERKKTVLEEKMPAKGPELPKKEKPILDKDPAKTFKPKSLNDKATKGLKIGLNDRLAFVKHLFNGEDQSYTRVLSQLETIKTWDEAADFIKGKVKPDYNHWIGKEEYSERFMNLVEKSFG